MRISKAGLGRAIDTSSEAGRDSRVTLVQEIQVQVVLECRHC